MNKIVLHAVPNGWLKQDYLQVWYFGASSYRETYDIFECV